MSSPFNAFLALMQQSEFTIKLSNELTSADIGVTALGTKYQKCCFPVPKHVNRKSCHGIDTVTYDYSTNVDPVFIASLGV